MIVLHWGLLLMFVGCVRTYEYVDNAVSLEHDHYSYWPSLHNALRLRKREATIKTDAQGLSEGGGGEVNSQSSNVVTTAPPQVELKEPSTEPPANGTNQKDKGEPLKAPSVVSSSSESPTSSVVATSSVGVNTTLSNGTHIPVAVPKQLDLHNSRVLMRGVIVFGGFLLLAVVYFIFYKSKTKKHDMGNSHNTNDANQFRYGVLQSDDRRDNMELSRVPLTLESDDDDDEDLEIFDLGQKKKSMSYVNLQTNDEDLVFQKSSKDSDNLLLDIEDATSDPLINWSNNDNKSIL